MFLVRGHRLNHVVEALERFAASYGVPRRPQRYVLLGGQLLPSRIADRNPALLLGAINKHRQRIAVDLPFDADSVDVALNARIHGFGPRRGHTVKVFLSDLGLRQPSFREIRGRAAAMSIVERTGEVTAPRVVAHDRARGDWLVEEHVSGMPVEQASFAALLAKLDRGLYRPTARLRVVAAGRIDRDSRHRVLDAWKAAGRGRLHDAFWPTALCHGDVISRNVVALSDGRHCFYDWEKVGIRPVAVELAKICRDNPALVPQSLDILQGLDPALRALPPRIQLAFAATYLLEDEQRNRRAFERFAEITLGFDRSAARDFAGGRVSGLEAVLAGLDAMG